MAAITRLGLWGHNTRRTGSFAGRQPTTSSEPAFASFSNAAVTVATLSDDARIQASIANGAVITATMLDH